MQCRLFYCIMENEQRGMITFILAVCGNVDYVYSFPLRRLHGRRGLKYVAGEFKLRQLVAAFTGGVD